MKKNNWRSILSIILGIIVIFVSIVMIKSLDVSVAKYKFSHSVILLHSLSHFSVKQSFLSSTEFI